MDDTFDQAGTYELTGGGATIRFDVPSGELRYRGPSRPPLRDFLEVTDTVEPVETLIGRVVTATLRAAEDGDSLTVTVLLPRVNLRPGGSAGFESVIVWTTIRSSLGGPGLVDGAVQDYVHRTAQGTAALAEAGGPCRFVAVHDREPPGPAKLWVAATCTFGSPGFVVELCRHEPQGINPRDLLLDLTIIPPDGVEPQVVTTVDVRYEEQTEAELDTVTILPDGISVPVVNAS
jgi:hypothetical protein